MLIKAFLVFLNAQTSVEVLFYRVIKFNLLKTYWYWRRKLDKHEIN